MPVSKHKPLAQFMDDTVAMMPRGLVDRAAHDIRSRDMTRWASFADGNQSYDNSDCQISLVCIPGMQALARVVFHHLVY